MIYLKLFFEFLKVGCFSFGGAYSAIPLIRDLALSNGWLEDEMLSYMIAVSESSPGPIMINLATYVGTAQAGLLGAFTATLAVVLPSFVITILITAILARVMKNKYVQAVLRGLTPCIIGIILSVGAAMTVKNILGPSLKSVDIRAMIITALLALMYYVRLKLVGKRFSPIVFIVISALFGAVGYAI